MGNLSEQIIKKMGEGNYTIVRFADECDVSVREINKIKNREAASISLNTLVKICETHEISYMDIFDCTQEKNESYPDAEILRFVLTDGVTEYRLLRK